MLQYNKVIDVSLPIEDHVLEAKRYLNRIHEGDIIDWATMSWSTEVQTFEGMDVTVFTLTVESALSLATTYDKGDPS